MIYKSIPCPCRGNDFNCERCSGSGRIPLIAPKPGLSPENQRNILIGCGAVLLGIAIVWAFL